jgi:hypothetical protein
MRDELAKAAEIESPKGLEQVQEPEIIISD